MSKKPESRLQRRIRKILEEEIGGFWFKVHGGPFQQEGIPDLLGCVDGLYFGLEVKRPKDRKGASDIQLEIIDDIKAAGGCALIVKTPDEALTAVKRHLRKHHGNESKPRTARLLREGRRR